MAQVFELDPVRADILETLQLLFGAERVTLAKIPPQLLLRSAMLPVIVKAAPDMSFVTEPRDKGLQAGYLAEVGDVGTCYIKAAMQDGKQAEDQVCVEVRVDGWEQSKGVIVCRLVIDLKELYKKHVVVTDAAVKAKANEVVWWLDRFNEESPYTEICTYHGGIDYGMLSIYLYHPKSADYLDFEVDQEIIWRNLRTLDDSYKLGDQVWAEKGDDCFSVRVYYRNDLLMSCDADSIAQKVDQDMRRVQHAIGVEYYNALNAHIAQQRGITILPFSDELGAELVGEGGRPEFRLSAKDSTKFCRETGLDFKQSLRTYVTYLPGYQMFGIRASSQMYSEYMDREKMDRFVSDRADEALKLGFIFYVGDGPNFNHIYFIKPIGGNFDYEKTLPELCQIITNAMSECLHKAEYGKQVAECKRKWSIDV